MSIRVNDFQWIPGKNDAEYIKLLKSSRDEWQKIAQKAIAKLKTLSRAQEPRVLTLEEIHFHEVYWIEEHDVSRPWPSAMHHIRNAGLLDGPVYQDYMGDNWNTKEYGKTWRVWTSRPTDEQREEIAWKS